MNRLLIATRLVVIRVLLVLFTARLAQAGTHFDALSRQTWFTDATHGFHAGQVLPWVTEGTEDARPFFLFACGLGLLLDQILTAGTIRHLAPGAEHGRFQSVWATVIGQGTRHLWPLLRTIAAAAVLGGLGSVACMVAYGALADRVEWTAPLAAGFTGLAICWLSLVSGFSHLAQVLAVGQDRTFVRTALRLTLRLSWREPLRGPLAYALCAGVAATAPAILVVAWRADDAANWQLWAGSWAVLMAAQAVVWLGLIHLGWSVWARHPDLRDAPDTDLGLVAWVRAKASRTA